MVKFLYIFSKKQPGLKKWAKEPNRQQVYKKVLNLIDHQGNANQNHNEISPHTC